MKGIITCEGGDKIMMGHGKHDNCMICSMGKTLGIIKKCTGKNCTHESHKEERINKESMRNLSEANRI